MDKPVYLRPLPGEYPPYQIAYIGKVPEGDVVNMLTEQIAEVLTLLRPLTEAKAESAYAPGKWSIKEVIGHCSDAERVFAYRATRIARADETPLPGFDENAWVPPARFGERSLASLLDEWVAVRASSVALFGGLPPEATARLGTASGNPVSVRALAFVIHGHVAHHLGILRERYL